MGKQTSLRRVLGNSGLGSMQHAPPALPRSAWHASHCLRGRHQRHLLPRLEYARVHKYSAECLFHRAVEVPVFAIGCAITLLRNLAESDTFDGIWHIWTCTDRSRRSSACAFFEASLGAKLSSRGLLQKLSSEFQKVSTLSQDRF